MKNLPHPIQYQGSKRALAPTILRYFPKNIDCLIEPFAGSAAISIAAAAHRLAQSHAINDINKPLAELLRMVVEQPVKLASFYEALWEEQHSDSIEHYYQVRERFNRTQDPRLFLYMLARCVKGSVRYNSDGMFIKAPTKGAAAHNLKRCVRTLSGCRAYCKVKQLFRLSTTRKFLRPPKNLI